MIPSLGCLEGAPGRRYQVPMKSARPSRTAESCWLLTDDRAASQPRQAATSRWESGPAENLALVGAAKGGGYFRGAPENKFSIREVDGSYSQRCYGMFWPEGPSPKNMQPKNRQNGGCQSLSMFHVTRSNRATDQLSSDNSLLLSPFRRLK